MVDGHRGPFAAWGHDPFPARGSPIPFGTLASVATLPVEGTPWHLGNGWPVVTTERGTGRRQLELVLELGRPYTAEDVVVRVNGRRFSVKVVLKIMVMSLWPHFFGPPCSSPQWRAQCVVVQILRSLRAIC